MTETPTTGQKVAAEVIGTFVLVFFGCAAAILSEDYVAIALAFGLALLVGVYSFGRISGAHFNPAVTVGAALSGRLAWRQTPIYIGSQLVGALLAGLTLFVLMQGFDNYDVSENGLGQNAFGDNGSGFDWWAAFLLEMLLTMVFLWVILAVTDARNEHPALAPAAIGLALTMIHLASITATGTSVNPARSIGVGVYAGTDAITDLWLFILAPLLGGAIAGLTYPLLFGHATEPVAGSGLRFGRSPAGAVPGYGAPDQFQQEWNQPDAATHQHQNWEPEPIIQDGWQWDHQAQEWKPLEQWHPADPSTGATATQQGWAQHDPHGTEQPTAQTAQPWTEPEGGHTQIRPPQ